MKKFVLGVVVGILLLVGARFAFTPWYQPPHYHANWAVFIDGDRLDLSADRYMEDVDACVAAGRVQPSQRVHMHENDDDVVHVHHEGVTWGHFLRNLDFVLGDDHLITDDGRRFFSEDDRTLKFVVDGFLVDEIDDRLIEPGDRVLISYGPERPQEALETQFPRVADDAEEYDRRQDPAGCAGAGETTIRERLMRALWGRR